MSDPAEITEPEAPLGAVPANVPGFFTIRKAWDINGVSHGLRRMPKGHKCRRNHGHNYVVTIEVTTDTIDNNGIMVDFGDLEPFGRYAQEIFDTHTVFANAMDISASANYCDICSGANQRCVRAWLPPWKLGCTPTSRRAAHEAQPGTVANNPLWIIHNCVGLDNAVPPQAVVHNPGRS